MIRSTVSTAGALMLALLGSTALAQTANPSGAPAPSTAEQPSSNVLADVVVTARRRTETLQEVPAAINAYNKVFIDTYKIENVRDIASFTPGIVMGQGNSVGAGNLYIRGIGASTDSALLEPASAVDVDGVQVSTQIMSATLLDLGEVQVLRGPQSLYYGKSAVGGVIALTSAAPTNSFYFTTTAGYDFEANNPYVQAVISGPLTSTLKGRLAVQYSNYDGPFQIQSATLPAFGVPANNQTHGPDGSSYVIKGGLAWNPTDRFDMTTNVTYTKMFQTPGVILQKTFCPLGVPQDLGLSPGYSAAHDAAEDCKADNKIFETAMTPAELALSPLSRNKPLGYEDDEQLLVTNTANYDLGHNLKLTSVTGLYDARDDESVNFSDEPLSFVYATDQWYSQQYSEELRLSSSFDGPVNFLLGGYYQYSRDRTALTVLIAENEQQAIDQSRNLYSAFAQMMIKPTQHIEIDAGGRYTYDQKSGVYETSLLPLNDTKTVTADWPNFSPEVTAKYKFNDHANVYIGYKQGFISGGLDASSGIAYNVITDVPGTRPVYKPETVSGVEGGIKASTEDNRLRVNLAAFSYSYSGLQLTQLNTQTYGITVQNVGSASSQGAEFDFTYHPPGFDNFSIYGNVGYLHARYTDFIGNCYDGQTYQNGCNLAVVGGKIVPANGTTIAGIDQNQKGKQLQNAPDWSAALGGQYEQSIGDWRMALSADGQYSSAYNGNIQGAAAAEQPAYFELNASMRLKSPGDHWELAVIGRNLTDQYVAIQTDPDFISGGAAGAVTGKIAPHNAPVDYYGDVNPGREVSIEVTYKY